MSFATMFSFTDLPHEINWSQKERVDNKSSLRILSSFMMMSTSFTSLPVYIQNFFLISYISDTQKGHFISVKWMETNSSLFVALQALIQNIWKAVWILAELDIFLNKFWSWIKTYFIQCAIIKLLFVVTSATEVNLSVLQSSQYEQGSISCWIALPPINQLC